MCQDQHGHESAVVEVMESIVETDWDGAGDGQEANAVRKMRRRRRTAAATNPKEDEGKWSLMLKTETATLSGRNVRAE